MTIRKPGLWLDSLRVEVEDVKTSHRKECDHCEEIPETRRLFIRRGCGRSAATGVLCVECGADYLAALSQEGTRAIEFLRFGRCPDGEGIRLPEE